MASFLGSGSHLLQRNYAPCYDRFDFDDDEEADELRASTDSHPEFQTLDEFGYKVSPYGGIILDSKKTKVEAVWKKTKVPPGTKITPLGDRECGICMTDIDDEELVTTECKHKYCRGCISYYLHLQSGDIKNLEHTLSYLENDEETGNLHLRIIQTCGVVCPHPTCTKIIEGSQFKSLADDETWQRFENLSIRIALRRFAKFGIVIPCPETNCDGYVQECSCSSSECRERMAVKAEQERLRLYKAWKVAEARGAELLRKWAMGVARQCPQCGYLIEKNGGCDHMYCTNCKTRYNWSASSLGVSSSK
jgi:hypothetical protein